MISYSVVMKILAWLDIRNNVTESQIRGYLAGFKDDADARLQALVDAAPGAAQAVLDGTSYKLKVNPIEVGKWELYPKIVMDVTVADGITMSQVLLYVESYWDQAKTDLRALVASAPAGANAAITEWHVHRLSGSVDELEP